MTRASIIFVSAAVLVLMACTASAVTVTDYGKQANPTSGVSPAYEIRYLSVTGAGTAGDPYVMYFEDRNNASAFTRVVSSEDYDDFDPTGSTITGFYGSCHPTLYDAGPGNLFLYSNDCPTTTYVNVSTDEGVSWFAIGGLGLNTDNGAGIVAVYDDPVGGKVHFWYQDGGGNILYCNSGSATGSARFYSPDGTTEKVALAAAESGYSTGFSPTGGFTVLTDGGYALFLVAQDDSGVQLARSLTLDAGAGEWVFMRDHSNPLVPGADATLTPPRLSLKECSVTELGGGMYGIHYDGEFDDAAVSDEDYGYAEVDMTPPVQVDNIVCGADPEYLTATTPTKTVDVNYLGGGSDLVYGYSIVFSWDGAIAGTVPGSVAEGTLLSDEGSTFFFPRVTGTNEITVDCMLLGTEPGVSGPGTMFSIEFTGLAVGVSDIDITIDRVRDLANGDLTGFFEDDGELIVDVQAPVVTVTFIENVTLAHTDGYIKNTDTAQVTATVTDDDPAFGATNIVADLTGLGGGAAVTPDDYTAGVATWDLASVACNPANGGITVTVTATDPIGNVSSMGDGIIADNIAPTVVTGFDAAPGHEQCDLGWTNGTDSYYAGTMVRRYAEVGEYPHFPWFVGHWPAVTARYPDDELSGTGVYDGTGTSHTDGYAPRNIYYYQAFCYDEARNYGPAATTARDLATNYWLGDVSDVWGSWGYDGEVDDDDILKLSESYWTTLPLGTPGIADCDVGPTVHPDWSRVGLPLPDAAIEFEDAMIFAMNYGVVTAKVVPFLPEPFEPAPLALALGGSETRGDEVAIALRLEGNSGDVKGLSASLIYNSSELEFVSASLSDNMVSPLGDVFFMHRDGENRVELDAVVLGTGVTIGGSGDVAVLTFRALTESYTLEVEEARVRGVDNAELVAKLGDYSSGGELPLAFRLVGNTPNPFNPVTKIAYHVPHESEVAIRVYDVSGRIVTTLVDGVSEPGRHVAVWNGTNDRGESVGSGVYFCTMEAPDFHESRKMTLLK